MRNGGSISTTRLMLLSRLVWDWQRISWHLIDDVWMLTAEDEVSALVSLKQARLSTIGGGTPTFTADQGYAFNGISDFLNTGFIASTMARVMSGDNLRMAIYERTNVAANTYTAGGQNNTTSRNLRLCPRSAAGAILAYCDSDPISVSGIVDSRGYTAASRSGVAVAVYKNGVAQTIASGPTSTGSTLTNQAFTIGATSGTSFRASTVGLVVIGATLTADQELAEYNLIQTYMTTLGANV